MTPTSHPVRTDELAAHGNGSLTAARREAIDAHLAACPDCRTDLAGWQAIRDAVRLPAVHLPAEQSDAARHQRVLAGVLAALDDPADAAASIVTVPPPPPPTPLAGSPSEQGRARSRWSSPLRVAAAAAVVVFAVIAVQPLGTPTAEALLQTAAATAAQWGTATMTIEGETTVALGAATADDADDADDALTMTFAITGEGVIAVPDRMHVRIAVAHADPLGGDARTETVEVLRIGETAWTRTDGRWAVEADRTEPGLGLGLLRPDLATLLRSADADGDVADLGTEQIDGTATRRIAFDQTTSTVEPDQSSRVEVWIDDDGFVHQLRHHIQGPASDPTVYLRTQLTARLHDFGAPVDIPPPPTTVP